MLQGMGFARDLQLACFSRSQAFGAFFPNMPQAFSELTAKETDDADLCDETSSQDQQLCAKVLIESPPSLVQV